MRKTPLLYDGREETIKRIPNLENLPEPDGFKKTNVFFVDSSGFGSEREPALTFRAFMRKVQKGKYYAITHTGQFQVYITEYEKTKRTLKGYIRLEGVGRHMTTIRKSGDNIIVTYWKTPVFVYNEEDKETCLNSGGYYTMTTKKRINECLRRFGFSQGIIQHKGVWYVGKEEFKDGMTLKMGKV